jgi:hypothetical protein
MLMDNKGGSSAAYGGGSGENIDFLNAPENNSGEVKTGAAMEGYGELGEMRFSGEDKAEEPLFENDESTPSELAPEPQPQDSTAEVTPLKSKTYSDYKAALGSQKRNEDPNSKVTKAFVSTLNNEELRNDPHELQEEVNQESWDFIDVAFDRKMGDGLNPKSKGELVA